MNQRFVIALFFWGTIGGFSFLKAQTFSPVLGLRQAIDSGMHHYGLLRSKRNIQKSRLAGIESAKSENYPDFSISAQQDFGSINSAFGPLYSYKGLSVASSGPTRQNPSWNAAFGALYLANIQWDFFAFGKSKEKVNLSRKYYALSGLDLDQEEFQQKIKISAAYLSLLAAKTLLKSQKANLDRAISLRDVVLSRTQSGLNPGVDSSIANAQVSNARFLMVSAEESVQELETSLGILMGISPKSYNLDSTYSQSIPKDLFLDAPRDISLHPTLKYYQGILEVQNQNIRFLKKTALPVFTVFDVFQSKASGFDYNYGDANPNAFTQNYFKGISPSVSNYLIGLGVTWNVTGLVRIHRQVLEQNYYLESLKNNFEQTYSEILAQQNLSNSRLKNALKQYQEGPIQVKAAKDAYIQKSVLFKNGLSNIVDVSQTLFALNQAETQLAVAYNNVWSALLLKTASNGDFNQFLNQIP